MKIFAVAAAALAGLAFWRRKTFKEDVVRVKDAGKGAATKVTSRVRHKSDESAEASDEEQTDEGGADDDSEVLVGDDSDD